MNWKFWQRIDDTIGPDPTQAHSLDGGFDAKPAGGSVIANHTLFKVFFGTAGLYLVGAVGIGIWWSQEPGRFDVARHAETMTAERNESLVTGYVTTAATIRVARTLMAKPRWLPDQ